MEPVKHMREAIGRRSNNIKEEVRRKRVRNRLYSFSRGLRFSRGRQGGDTMASVYDKQRR